MQNSEAELGNLKQKNPKKFKRYREIFDSLYQQTERNFKGTLMLPIMQGMDARLGSSRGECFGYAVAWITQISLHKKFCGIPLNGTPHLKVMPLKSVAWETYPDLNHMAVLNEDISFFQKMQGKTYDILSRLASYSKNPRVDYERRFKFKSYDSVSEIAEKLVKSTYGAEEKMCMLSCLGYLSGHALGFYKGDGKYHFMDSNSGWFRFESEKDFKKWLPFYFKKMGYDKYFAEYNITKFFLKKTPIQPKEKISIGSMIILSPLIAVFLLAFLFYFFVISGIKYCIRDIKNSFKKNESSLTEEVSNLVVETSLPKSLEPLDLALKPLLPKEKESPSSMRKIAAMLDIPLKDLASVQKRAENNEQFKQKRKPVADNAPILNDQLESGTISLSFS